MGEASPHGPVIHVSTMGNLGNQMIQYMAAVALAGRAGACRFSNINLPLWSVAHPWIEGDFPLTEIVTAPALDMERLARALSVGQLQRVDIRTYGQRIENFPAVDTCRELFRHQGPAYAGAADDELLCSIRQGDILDARHPDYVLVPADFYADLAEETGLRLVFMGQLDETPYLQYLRQRFPHARFLPSRGPAADFERIRRSRFIVPSISTFAWLAAWLSEAERIFLPVLGLFHPRQVRGVALLPLEDPRYRFYLFPIHYAVPVAEAAAAHASIHRLWRYMPPDVLGALLAHPPPDRPKSLYLEAFDEGFYRATYPDIAKAIDDGHFPNGRAHYDLYGFAEGRAGFPLDRTWYCRTYPIAAIEISQGAYLDADHHWLEIGSARRYRRGDG
jgi:transcriptional regulator with XRE-family HTH domain